MTIHTFHIKQEGRKEDLLEIRPRTTEDLNEILQLYKSVPEEERDFFIADVNTPENLSRWFEPNEFVETVALVAVTNNRIVGEAVCMRQKSSRTSHVGTVRFYIRPDFRNLGIGAMLVSSLLTESMNIGIEKITVYIPEPADTKYSAVLTKTGFTREAVLKDHFRTDAGTKQNVIVYGRDLEELWHRISDWLGNYGRAMEY